MTDLVAKFIKNIVVTDPDTGLEVELCIYKDMSTEGIFGVDASYIEQMEPETINSPFSDAVLTFVGD